MSGARAEARGKQEAAALKTRTKVAITTLVVGVPAFVAAPAIWPSPARVVEPSAAQMPFLVFLGALEALGLGLGVAFVLFGWPRLLRNAGSPRSRTLAVCASVSWLLVCWWPYDIIVRRYAGEDVQSLVYVEYGFHATLIVCGIVLAYALLRYDPLLREARRMTRIS